MPEETNLLGTRLFRICAERSVPLTASVALLLFTLWGAGVRFPERTLQHIIQVITPIVYNSHTSILMLHIRLRPLKISAVPDFVSTPLSPYPSSISLFVQ
jgi:hypothetical protein